MQKQLSIPTINKNEIGQHHRQQIVDLVYTQQNAGKVILEDTDYQAKSDKVREAETALLRAREDFMKYDLSRYFWVAFFGSARLPKNSEEFKKVRQFSEKLVIASDGGIGVCAGGGVGIMGAALQGVHDAHKKQKLKYHAKAKGTTLDLPTEPPSKLVQLEDKHVDFFTRLQSFFDATRGAYLAPGGIGTLLEGSFLWQLKQMRHLEESYLVFADASWEPIFASICDELYHKRAAAGRTATINESDLDAICFARKEQEIIDSFVSLWQDWQKNVRSNVEIVYNPK